MLEEMSLDQLVLHPGAGLEPRSTVNADAIGYCLEGQGVVSFSAPEKGEVFSVTEGDAFFLPCGSLYSFTNSGSRNLTLLLAFSHEEPKDFPLSTTLKAFSNEVLGHTWGVPSTHFQELNRSPDAPFIVEASSPKNGGNNSPYKFSLVGEGLKTGEQKNWSLLKKQSIASFSLSPQDMQGPHWHPKTAELGYVESGQGKISMLSTSGKIDTYPLEQGDIYFVPKGHPHSLENGSGEDLHLVLFFDQATPEEIRLASSISPFSKDLLSAVFKSPKRLFETL